MTTLVVTRYSISLNLISFFIDNYRIEYNSNLTLLSECNLASISEWATINTYAGMVSGVTSIHTWCAQLELSIHAEYSPAFIRTTIDQRPRNQDNTNFPSHRSPCGTAISIVFLLYRPCVRWHRCAHGVISTVVVSWMDINHSNGGFARVKHDVQSDHIIYPRWLKEVRSWLCATR